MWGGRPQRGSALLVTVEVSLVRPAEAGGLSGFPWQNHSPPLCTFRREVTGPHPSWEKGSYDPLPCYLPNISQPYNCLEAGSRQVVLCLLLKPSRSPQQGPDGPPSNHGPPPAAPGPIPPAVNAPWLLFPHPHSGSHPQLPKPAQNSRTLTFCPPCWSPAPSPPHPEH